MSAAHMVLQRGGRVLLLDKMPICGGNSTKATSGINGAGTSTQRSLGVGDSPEAFLEDTKKSAKHLYRPELAKVLTYESGPAVEWLKEVFALDLSLVSPLGGHSYPRTHRGGERFPGMTITYRLIEKFEEACETMPERAQQINRAKVVGLKRGDKGVTGVYYEQDGVRKEADGIVILATGGYGADFSGSSLITKHRPDLIGKKLATTNAEHATGDGVRIADEVGAGLVDMEYVQVHPTGMVDPKDPDSMVKFLAAEALRGVGGILLDRNGKRFVNELGTRDFVTGQMWEHNQGPYHLILCSGPSNEIKWHCHHYTDRGLMRKYANGTELAKALGVSPDVIRKTLEDYNKGAAAKNDQFGRKLTNNIPLDFNDFMHEAIVTPVVHYTMGGVAIDGNSQCLDGQGKPIPGLYAAGEVAGGIHGANRLGGSSLLDCVAFGRVSGRSAAKELLTNQLTQPQGSGGPFSISVDPTKSQIVVSWGAQGSAAPAAASATPAAKASAPKEVPKKELVKYTHEEVAKHTSETDCWVIVHDNVLDVTSFMKDHPGGRKPILQFAGRDATDSFDMLHPPGVIEKHAPETIIGYVESKAKL